MTLYGLARRILLGALCLLPAIAPAFAGLSQDDLLDPEKAFEISARPLDEKTVEVRFRIADGYYMYRDRFKFETESGAPLADVELPPGLLKTDPFFGETQTFRRETLIRVPVGAEEMQRGHLKLKVTSQGCSDSGVCYVPLEQVVDVRLSGGAGVGGGSALEIPSMPVVLRLAWVQALIALTALALFGLSVRFAPALARWRSAARGRSWVVPGFGFAFAALALLSAYPLLAQPFRDFAWGALLVMAAVWLRAIDPLPNHAPGVARLAKGIGVLALAAGILLLAFAAGWRAPASPGSGSGPGVSAASETATFERVSDLNEFDARVRSAGRPTLLDFYADWCVTCKEMERYTFSAPAVRARMSSMQLLQVDVTRNTDSDKAFLKRFAIFGPPAILFFDTAGNEMRELRVIGFQSAERFTPTLDRALRAAGPGARSATSERRLNPYALSGLSTPLSARPLAYAHD